MSADLRLWALRGAFDAMLDHEERAYHWFGHFLYMLVRDVGGAALAHQIAARNADLAAEAAEAYREFFAAEGRKVDRPASDVIAS